MKRFAEVLLLLVACTASAEAAQEKRVIVVVAPASEPLDAVVRERVSAAGGELDLAHAESIERDKALASTNLPHALAHVWIDFTGPRAILLLLDEKLERGFVRYASRDRGDEIAREELGHALQTAIEGLLAGMTIGVGRETLVPVRPVQKKIEVAPVPEPAPPPPWHVRAGGTYGLEAFGAGLAVHGPGAAFDVLRRIDRAFAGVRFAGQARFPGIASGIVETRIETWAARASLLAGRVFGAWSLEGALGGGFDIEHVVPVASMAGARLASPSTNTAPFVHVAVAIAHGVPRLALLATMDFDLSPLRLDVVDSSGARSTVVSASAVRPGIAVEIGTP